MFWPLVRSLITTVATLLVVGVGWATIEPAWASNNQRVQARPTLLPILRERLATRSAAELSAAMETAGLPYAPIRRPASKSPSSRRTGSNARPRFWV